MHHEIITALGALAFVLTLGTWALFAACGDVAGIRRAAHVVGSNRIGRIGQAGSGARRLGH